MSEVKWTKMGAQNTSKIQQNAFPSVVFILHKYIKSSAIKIVHFNVRQMFYGPAILWITDAPGASRARDANTNQDLYYFIKAVSFHCTLIPLQGIRFE